MFCTVKYIEYSLFKDLESTENLPEHVSTENKELLINPNCPIQIIMDYIYSEIGVDSYENINIDLTNVKGAPLKTYAVPPNTNGLALLTRRETYYIIVWEGNRRVVLELLQTFLLNKYSKEFSDLNMTQKKSSSIRSDRRSSAQLSTTSSKVTGKRRGSAKSLQHRKSIH